MKSTLESKCPICNFVANYLFLSKHNFEIMKCSNEGCKHLFTPPKSATQGVHRRSEDIMSEAENSLQIYGERNQRLLGLLLDNLNQKIHERLIFLDFGAGDAHISRTFKNCLKEKVDIYCVEEEEICKPIYSEYDLIQIDKIENIPVKANLIYAIEVIEHVEDPVSVLLALKDVLAEGGVIFLSTPPGHINQNRTNAYDNPTHIHFFTPTSLNLALVAAELSPIKYQYFPEMYPLTTENNLLRIFKRPYVKVVQFFLKYNLSRSIGMPPTTDGMQYPYHLVGFTKRLSDNLQK